MKILNTIFKRDSDELKIPHSVQGILPVQTIWQDGIFLVGKNKYSKSFKFMDINYAVASKEQLRKSQSTIEESTKLILKSRFYLI